MIALAGLAASVVLQAGQVQWFLPGALHPGQQVLCSVAPHVFAGRVPASGGADWAWTGGAQMSIQRASNGAVEAACNTQLVSRRPSTMPYVIGQNGLALIRGRNRLSQLERRYGSPSSTHSAAGACTVVWNRAAITADFTSCSAGGTLVRAAVTSTRWGSLSDVRIGDSLPRLLFEAPFAKRVGAFTWRLAAGSQYHSELVAELGTDGRVARLVAMLR